MILSHQPQCVCLMIRNIFVGDSHHGDFTLNKLVSADTDIRRLFLHASSLEFLHPVSGESLRFEAVLPLEFNLVLDHYENPRNVGTMEKDDPSVGTGMVGAPACGDVMRLQIKVNDDGVIEDARFKTCFAHCSFITFRSKLTNA